MTSEPHGDVPIIYGHRGMSARAPENTMAAFGLLLEEAIPGVELDVHQCGSGEIVVSHDDNLVRTAGVELALRQSPLGAIQEHDIGSWFGPEFAAERVPTLEQVFALLGNRVVYDIEIKPYGTFLGGPRDGGIEEAVKQLIERHGLADRCMVSSFDPLLINRFRKLTREIPTALIYASARDLPFAVRNGRGRLFSRPDHLKPRIECARPSLVKRLSARGRRVIPWTVDDPVEALRLVAIGVHGLISNVPDQLIRAIQGVE